MQIKEKIKQNKHVLILFLATVFLVSLPVVSLFFTKNFNWHGLQTVVGSYGNGPCYYYARIKEIKDGYPFMGNPYFLEHNQEITPAFFLADWMAYVPLLLGASFNASLFINLIFWSLVFVFLAYLFLQKIGVSKICSAIGAFLSYFQVYFLMTSPVSMQIIFPFFLFFLWTFAVWFQDSTNKKKKFLLIISSAFSFYVYTYLWQIVLTLIFLSILYLFLSKDKKRVWSLLTVLFSTLVLSAPLFVYTFKQLSHLDYWDTMQRIGFVSTHLPTAEVYYSGRWIILLLLVWLLSWFWIKELKENKYFLSAFKFFALSGSALVIVSASNVITGKELELAQHIVRFILVWLPLAFVALVFFLKQNSAFFRLNNKKSVLLVVLLLICLGGLASYYGEKIAFFKDAPAVAENIEKEISYSAPLVWLDTTEKNSIVVWADPKGINNYVPITTKHYVLFSNPGILQLLPSSEANERYLVANYFNNLTLSDIENDFQSYAGSGNAVHPYKIYNRKVKLCRILHLNYFGYNCGDTTTSVGFKGEQYFNTLYEQYINEIKPNIKNYLLKYHVSYVIQDLSGGMTVDPKEIDGVLVYNDGIFLIYKLPF